MNTYTVQSGDTLMAIAQKTLGQGDRWPEIAALNKIQSPRDLRVGMALKLPAPTPSVSFATLPKPTPPAKPAPAKPIPTPPKPTASSPATKPPASATPPKIQAKTYTVQAGDSLIRIAQKTLGNGDRWREIAKLNNITDPNALRVGRVLQIPTAAPATPVVPPSSVKPPAAKPPAAKPPAAKPPAVKPPTTPPSTAKPPATKPSATKPPATKPPATKPPAVVPPSGVLPSEFRYTVQAGDSLSKIAEKTLGDSKRWPEIGILNGIADPSKLSVGMVLRIPVGEQGPLEVAPLLGNVKQKVTREGVKFTQEQDNIFATWLKQARKEAVGVAYQKGLYRRGTQTPQSFIAEARSLLAGLRLSNSEMRAIAAAAENEGYLDAVNTWDSQYLSFGMFQWTAGSPELPGELGELLTQLKRRSPEAFQHYFQQFGLDVDGTDGVRGWLSLNGTRLISDYQKTILRQPIWAYRFAIAGSDPMVQAAEVLHAVTRLDTFYFVKQSSLDGYSLSRLITSELGVALLLDNHINRPAYVAPGLAEAMWQLGLAPQDLAQASTAEEQRVLDRYLKVRETYGTKPMTHAKTRGDRIRRQVAAGNLSNQRGSFVSNRALRRG